MAAKYFYHIFILAEKTQALLRLFGFTKNDLVTSENCTKSINALVSIGQELKLDSINKEK